MYCSNGLSTFQDFNYKIFNKHPDTVPEEAPLIILDSKSAGCMANNGKDIKHKSHIARKVHFVRNGEK